jgi:hypothetical protein
MKRLKHPIRAIREPFGTAGLIVAMIALVAALGGTALAAAKLNSTQKKEVEKIAKKFAGKAGANGANGTNGSAGAKGDKGDPGSPGSPGSPGAPGTSVVMKTLPKGNATCKEGGAEFEAGATKSHACNGSPWTAGGTLPVGSTETGAWAFGPVPEGSGNILAPVASFTIPLAAPLGGSGCFIATTGGGAVGPCNVHFISSAGKEVLFNLEVEHNEEVTSAACPGTAAAPAAESGNLCVYDFSISHAESSSIAILKPGGGGEGAGTTGAIETFIAGAGFAEGHGTWAVTG